MAPLQGDCDDEGPTCDSQPAEPQCTPPGQLVGLATQLQRVSSAHGLHGGLSLCLAFCAMCSLLLARCLYWESPCGPYVT